MEILTTPSTSLLLQPASHVLVQQLLIMHAL